MISVHALRRKAVVIPAAGVLALAGAAIPSVAAASSSSANTFAARAAGVRPTAQRVAAFPKGWSEQSTTLSFATQYDTYVFSVVVSGATGWGAASEDCCIPGDHWLTTVSYDNQGTTIGSPDPAQTASGNGSTTAFSGATVFGLNPANTYTITVIVSYAGGTYDFTAGMTEAFATNGTQTVTQEAYGTP